MGAALAKESQLVRLNIIEAQENSERSKSEEGEREAWNSCTERWATEQLAIGKPRSAVAAPPPPALPAAPPAPTPAAPPSRPAKPGTAEAPAPSAGAVYTLADVAAHADRNASMWTIIDGNVYDVTRFQSLHPGGRGALVAIGGEDGSESFHDQHPASHLAKMAPYLIGTLATPSAAGSRRDSACPPFAATLVESTLIAPTVKCLRFTMTPAVPQPLLPGGHLALKVPNTGAVRNYSPFEWSPTQFSVVVRVYPRGVGSEFLHSVRMGHKVAFSPPVAPQYRWDQRCAATTGLVLVAGGTGVAPLYGVARAAVATSSVRRVTFIGCFRDAADVLLAKELFALLELHPARLRIVLFLSRGGNVDAPSGVAVVPRRVDVSGLKELLPKYDAGGDGVICGTAEFSNAVSDALRGLGFPEDRIFEF